VLKSAVLYLGHDSGVTHLAAAASRDLPVIALFGPTDPKVWAPPREGVQVMRRSAFVSDITIDEVHAIAAKLLG
jgi:ADP-heptose:LPS heptosyltransferase